MKTAEDLVWIIEEFAEFKSFDKTDDRKRLLTILNKFESGIKLKIATKVRALTIDEITDADTLYNAILKT